MRSLHLILGMGVLGAAAGGAPLARGAEVGGVRAWQTGGAGECRGSGYSLRVATGGPSPYGLVEGSGHRARLGPPLEICAPEDDATFCARLGKDCGSVTNLDSCNLSRTAECGACDGPATCGGTGIPNVCGIPPADLTITALSFAPTTVGAGAAITIADTVATLGGPAGPFSVTYYLSADADVTPGDILLGSRWVDGLASGDASAAATTLTIPAVLGGTFYVGAIADVDGVVAESNEDNNVGVAEGLAIEPDLVPPVITVTGITDGEVTGADSVTLCVAAADANPLSVEGVLDGTLHFPDCTDVVAEKDYELVVNAVDAAGNTSTVALNFAIDWTAPVIAIGGVTDGLLTNAAQVVPVFSASDLHPGTTTATLAGSAFASGTAVTGTGDYVLTVSSVDLAGNAAQTEVRFAIDRVAPIITITGVSDGAVTSSAVTPVVQTSDPHPGPVDVQLNGQPFASGTTVDAPGPYTLAVSARDGAGNSSTAQVSFVIDRTAPIVTIESPATGTLTRADLVEVVITASDSQHVARVEGNGVSVGAGADGKYRWAASLAEGANTLTVTAYDDAGNSATATISVTRDTTPPALIVSVPAQDAYVYADGVAVKGSAADVTAVTVTVNGTSVALGDGNSFDAKTQVPAGDAEVRVVARDALGNESTVVRHVIGVGAPPTLAMSEPPDGFVATAPTIQVRGSAGAANGLSTVTVNGDPMTLGADGVFSTSVQVEKGEVTIDVVATDAYGLTTTRTLSGRYDGEPPPQPQGSLALAVDAPADGAITGLGTLAFNGRVEGGTPPITVTVAGVDASVNAGYFSAALALVEGDHVINIEARDAANGVAVASRSVSVDHTPPFVVVTRPASSSAIATESPYLIEGTVGDVHLAQVTVAGSPVSVVAGSFSSAVALHAGVNEVSIEARDLAGNVTTTRVSLEVQSLPPSVVIVTPLDGSEAATPVITVRATVSATAPLASVTVGTGAATQDGADWVAEVPLALGDNEIQVVATDTAGMSGSAISHVRYRDVSKEPLAITGVAPAPDATKVPPDSLVSVSFNKAVDATSLEGHFEVVAQGATVPGGFYVAPGGQTVSFIARRAYPEGERISVRVASLAAVEGPGMEASYASEFTVRSPIPRLWGSVHDENLEPVAGARVSIEGAGVETITGPDGNWSVFGLARGSAVVAFDGPVRSDGSVLGSLRHKVYVDGTNDTEDARAVLYPVDQLSAERVNAAGDVHVTFNGRHPGMWLDVSANGMYFATGSVTGSVTATRIPSSIIAVPVEAYTSVNALWQLGPSGIRFTGPVTMSLPVAEPLPDGRYVVILSYDPSRHIVTRGGLGRVETDDTGRRIAKTVEPMSVPALDFFGYMALDEEQQAIVEQALQSAVHPPQGGETGLLVPRIFAPYQPRSVLDYAYSLIGGVAHANLIDWEPVMGSMMIPRLDIHPWFVHGWVRSTVDVGRIELDASMPTDTPKIVTPDAAGVYWLPIELSATAGTSTGATSNADGSPMLLQAEIAATLDGVALAEPSPGAWKSPLGTGTAQVSASLPLRYGTTRIMLVGIAGADRKSEVYEAKLEQVSGTGGSSTGPQQARLTVAKVFDPSASADALVSFFKGWVVEAQSATAGAGATNDQGEFLIPVLAYNGWDPAIACTSFSLGIQYTPVKVEGEVEWRGVPSQYGVCTPASLHEVVPVSGNDLVIDLRVIHGALWFKNRDGSVVGGAGDPAATTELSNGQLTSISQADVGTTELHFFREDDLEHPIAKYAIAAPIFDWVPGDGHARYNKVRPGPKDWLHRNVGLRLSAGDRLVVFAINHATGYAGLTTVTVPPVTTSPGLAPGETCAADEAAGGPIVVDDLAVAGQGITISRCARQDITIAASVDLYPPEIDVRVARRVEDEGVENPATREEHLVRTGGMATTRDSVIQVSTHWRVRVRPEPVLAVDQYPGEAPPPDAGGGNWPYPAPAGELWGPGALTDFEPSSTQYSPGAPLEIYCSKLPAGASAEMRARCAATEATLVDVPAGVPPIAGHVVRVTQSAVETPANSVFRVRPGRSTSNVQTAFRYIDTSGQAHTINSLIRANYYVHVVGHSLFLNDSNGNGTFERDELEQRNPAPPNFVGEVEGSPGLPPRAVALKDVYTSIESDGSLLERYDRAREHEFRVSAVSKPVTLNALNPDGSTRDVTAAGSQSATFSDVGYQFLLELLKPDAASRAGTLSGEMRVRIGSDDYGVDCVLDAGQAAAGYVAANCGGEYLYDILSASDILYFEVYLSGNAENVLYRYNINGLKPRRDYLAFANGETAQASVDPDSAAHSAYRAVSEPALAVFFVSPAEYPSAHVKLRVGTKVLKEADLEVSSAGVFQIKNETTSPLAAKLRRIKETTASSGWAQRFEVAIPHELAQMPGASSDADKLLVEVTNPLEPSSMATAPLSLGVPQGQFVGMHPVTAGQSTIGGVNVVDGHLGLVYEDFSLPEYASTVQFVRSYDNQNNEVGPLGLGWTHNYEGFVVEEELGRYSVHLGGQAYSFSRCHASDASAETSTCDQGTDTDSTHGGRLVVGKDGAGLPDVTFTAANGHRYKFNRASVRSRDKYEQTQNGTTSVKVIEGRRRWVLTAFEDGHGQDPVGGPGWYVVTYYDDSDMVFSVARNGGKLTLNFRYEGIDFADPTVSGALKRKASMENFGLLEKVSVDTENTPDLIVLELHHDKSGNLLDVSRSGGTPLVEWSYGYRAVAASDPDKRAAVNELETVQLFHDGFLQEASTYGRNLTAAVLPHQADRVVEIVDRITLPGYQGTPYVILYGEGSRTITAPDGVETVITLNAYGNTKSITVGGQTVAQVDWVSDEIGKAVFPKASTLPYRKLTTDPSERLLPLSASLETAQGLPVSGLETRPGGLATWERDERFGIPKVSTFPGIAVSLNVSASGDIGGGTVTGGGTNAAFSITPGPEGVPSSQSDLSGDTTYSGENDFGEPTSATVTLTGATGLGSVTRALYYDAFGRSTGSSDSAGRSDVSTFDSLGRPLSRTVAGTPNETWTYTYVASPGALEITESLAETGYYVKRTYEDGLLTSEEFSYGSPAETATRSYTYEGGRLKSTTDELGFVHTPSYDAAGRIQSMDVGGNVTTYGRDLEGKVTSITDQNGLVTSIDYDRLGRPARWTYGDGDVVEVTRDVAGNIQKQTQGTHVVTFERDAMGMARKTLSESAGGGVDQYAEYDDLGRQTRFHDNVTGLDETFEYKDVLGRLTKRVRTIETRAAGGGKTTSTSTEGRTYAGNLVTVKRDVDGRQEEETETLDVRGRVLSVQPKEGTAITYGYDAQGRLKTVSGPVAISRELDPMGRLVKEVRGGVTTTFDNDAKGRLKDQWGPQGGEHWTFAYDAIGRVTSRTLDAVSGTNGSSTAAASWTYEYVDDTVIETGPLAKTTRTVNARGRVKSVEVSDPGGAQKQTTEYGYDGPDAISTTITEGGSVLLVTSSFDDRRRELSRVEAWSSGGTESYDYTTATPWIGRAAHVTETWKASGATDSGRVGDIEVDSLGNLVLRSFGRSEEWSYDAEGALLSEKRAGESEITYSYYGGRRWIQQRAQDAETTQYSYDGFGRVTSIVDPAGLEHGYGYDAKGLVASEHHGDESVSYSWDDGGFLLTMQRNAGSVYGYSHGPRGEVLGIQAPYGTYTVTNNAAGLPTSMAMPSGSIVPNMAFGYDYLGRESMRRRGTATWSTAYDGATRTTTAPTGDVRAEVVDGRGRVVKGTYTSAGGGARTVETAYDALDRLLYGQDPAGSSRFSYDASGRLTDVTRSFSGVTRDPETVHYGLDGYGRVESVESRAGATTYGYDPAYGRVSSVGSGARTTSVQWEPGGARFSSLEDGYLHEHYCYVNGRLKAVVSGAPGTTCESSSSPGVVSYEYTYDSAGNRSTETYRAAGSVEQRTFHYDSGDRLTGVDDSAGPWVTYGLAPDGTRVSEELKTAEGARISKTIYSYDTLGGIAALTDEDSGSSIATYQTDQAGRVIEEYRVAQDRRRRFEWAADDRLLVVKDSTAGVETVQARYRYDYAGRRIGATTTAGESEWLWDASGVVEERLPGAPSALFERVGDTVVAAGGMRVMHDGLGSIVGFAAGSAFRHDAWGAYVGAAPQAGIGAVGFAGQRWDADVGLSYAQQRWYDPRLGIFLSEDPVRGDALNPTSLSPFLYANGNPVMYVDPRGELADKQIGCLAGYLDSLESLHREHYWRADERTDEFLDGYRTCNGTDRNYYRQGMRAIHDSEFGTTAREAWLGTPWASDVVACGIGAGAPFLPDIDLEALPQQMQGQAAHCSFATGNAALVMTGVEGVRGARQAIRSMRPPRGPTPAPEGVPSEVRAASAADDVSLADRQVTTSSKMSAADETAGTSVVSEGRPAAPLEPGRTPLKQFDIDKYGSFAAGTRTGDSLAGHELLQNAWLREHGYTPNRGVGTASRNNPAVALGGDLHARVGVAQKKLGLFDRAKLREMSAADNIRLNVQAMREAGVPEHVIQTLEKEAMEHASSL